jgi:hypothetical protein
MGMFARFGIAVLLLSPLVASASYLDDIGWTQLHSELGTSTPNGSGVVIQQVEAPVSTSPLTYAPDATASQFAGITFTLNSGASAVSGHATNYVGNQLYGSNSMASGVTNVQVFEANDWVNNSLHFGGGEPATQLGKVINNSWIGSGLTTAQTNEILRRLDYTIRRDDVIVVNGLNNNNAGTVPQVLAPSYNSIAVGVTSGNHSYGTIPAGVDGAGRSKPDIVAPAGTTSEATAIVSSAAAVLVSAVGTLPTAQQANAVHSETVKATLLAGATRDVFTDWSRTTTSPLDAKYGVGQLNIRNSYNIQQAGEFDGTIAGVEASATGWDFGTTNGTADPLLYFFDLSSDANFSAALTWNSFTNGGPSTLADMNLELFSASGMSLGGTALQQSLSTIDNVEFLTLYLASGRYGLKVTSDTGMQDFALAWQALTVPEPSTWLLFIFGGLFLPILRRRQKV